MGLFYPHYPGAGSIALEVRGPCLGRGRGARSACCARCARCALGQVLFHALPRTFFKSGPSMPQTAKPPGFRENYERTWLVQGLYRVYIEYIYNIYSNL